MSNSEKIDIVSGGFAASFRPQLGGNLVRLQHLESGVEILRTPPDDAAYNKQPEVWGMPVLMPPNRIPDGKFTYQDRQYELPVNEPAPRHNSLHGILLRRAWDFRQTSENSVEMSIQYPGKAANEGWMHTFEAVLSYEFFENNVKQTLKFVNTSDLTMPLMVGFHSAFYLDENAQFYLDASRESRMLDDLRKIVNGKTEMLTEWQQFRKIAHGERVLGHCAMLRGNKENAELLIRYQPDAWQLRYQLPAPWREWVIWNGTGEDGFICVEPQSCRIDAMNIGLPLSEAGVIELSPGKEAIFQANIQMEKLQ